MGKRSLFKRRPQDAYDTPLEAVVPLISHLPDDFAYDEPCAGNLSLAMALDALTDSGCLACFLGDIEPRDGGVSRQDARTYSASGNADLIITNPPWTREILHPMIVHFSDMRPTWLLFDADWMHTKQAAPYRDRCRKVVSVGRVKWIPDSPHTGKDNCAWYLFDKPSNEPTRFFWRA